MSFGLSLPGDEDVTATDLNRMCGDLSLEKQTSVSRNNMNTITEEILPEKVLEMYHMLLEISSELDSIKHLLAKSKKVPGRSAEGLHGSTPSLGSVKDQDVLGNGAIPHSRPSARAPAQYDHDAQEHHSLLGNGRPAGLPLVPQQPRLEANEFTKMTDDEDGHSMEGPMHPPSPFLIVANKISKGPVILNVGGKRHEVRWNTLDKYPTSRLGRLRHCVTHRGLQQLCTSYSLEAREYFFDRSPRNFDAILGLYRTNKLHLAAGVCVQDFCEELEYWGLDDLHMEPCCQHTYYRARWLLPTAKIDAVQEDDFGTGCCAPMQRHLWNLFENPDHSKAAKAVAVVSCIFVIVSTLCLIFSTLPQFQLRQANGEISREEYFFEIAEAVFVGWFSFEYVVRFIAAPYKSKFVKGAMNVVDLLGILPYFMSLVLSLVTNGGREEGGIGRTEAKYESQMRRIAQIFRIMRILRIFKLARHITGLQTLALTLRCSYKELALLMLVVIMGMLIFSGLAYVGEKDEEGTMFDSMLTSLYWAIITMTSVGYGDIYPVTWFGKFIGAVCAICGVLCISLPIPIIVNNFNKFYEKSKIEEEIKAKKDKASWEDAKRGKLTAMVS